MDPKNMSLDDLIKRDKTMKKGGAASNVGGTKQFEECLIVLDGVERKQPERIDFKGKNTVRVHVGPNAVR